MRFLVVTMSNQAGSPELAPMMIAGMKQWAAEHTASGKMEQIWAFAGQPGGGGIIKVDTLDELDAVMAGFPFAQYSKIHIYPLVDLNGALDRTEAVIKKMMGAAGH